MSAKPPTKSAKKLEQWTRISALGKRATEIARDRNIPLIEAYKQAFDEEKR